MNTSSFNPILDDGMRPLDSQAIDINTFVLCLAVPQLETTRHRARQRTTMYGYRQAFSETLLSVALETRNRCARWRSSKR